MPQAKAGTIKYTQTKYTGSLPTLLGIYQLVVNQIKPRRYFHGQPLPQRNNKLTSHILTTRCIWLDEPLVSLPCEVLVANLGISYLGPKQGEVKRKPLQGWSAPTDLDISGGDATSLVGMQRQPPPHFPGYCTPSWNQPTQVVGIEPIFACLAYLHVP